MAAALARICRHYWNPLYLFVRRHGTTHEDAQDLVQGFIAHLLEKNTLSAAVPHRGHFRSFLLAALKQFLLKERLKTHRLKRGGGSQSVPLDEPDAATALEPKLLDTMTPEKAFDRRWALTLLERVFDRLQAEYQQDGHAQLYAELSPFLIAGQSDTSSAEVAERMGMGPGTFRVNVSRLRQRYGQLLRLEISFTVHGPETIDDELRHLYRALA
jgi:RNA polymerase sigma-70 factor (ECF subfamily)